MNRRWTQCRSRVRKSSGSAAQQIAANALDGHGNRYGLGDDPVNHGIPASEAAATILSGMRAGKREIPVGNGQEMQALWLKRFLPNAVFNRTAKMAPKRG